MDDYTAMIVDDEEQIRKVFSIAFQQHGINVITAGSAEEALLLIEPVPCWVYFIDLKLPGMNGIELCRRIRNKLPMAIAFAVTGYVSMFELTECRDAGFEDYFTKPVELADLIKAAENSFEKLARWKIGR